MKKEEVQTLLAELQETLYLSRDEAQKLRSQLDSMSISEISTMNEEELRNAITGRTRRNRMQPPLGKHTTPMIYNENWEISA